MHYVTKYILYINVMMICEKSYNMLLSTCINVVPFFWPTASSDKNERRQAPARAGPPGVGRAAEGPRGMRRRQRPNRMRQREEDSGQGVIFSTAAIVLITKFRLMYLIFFLILFVY